MPGTFDILRIVKIKMSVIAEDLIEKIEPDGTQQIMRAAGDLLMYPDIFFQHGYIFFRKELLQIVDVR